MAQNDKFGNVAKVNDYISLSVYPNFGYGKITSINGPTLTVLMYDGKEISLTNNQ